MTPILTTSAISIRAASPTASKGDDEHALADYDLCLQMRPNFANAYNNRGVIYLRRGDCSAPSRNSTPPSRFASSDPTRYTRISTIARASQTLRKQYDSALADFAEAQKLNPDGPQIPRLPLHHLHRDGEIRRSVRRLQRGAGEDIRKIVYALTSRGNAYLAKGDLDAALKDYNEAIKISPNYIRAHAGRGQLLREAQGRRRRARYDYRSASAALTKVDDTDTAIARRLAKERLAALVAAAPLAHRPPSRLREKPQRRRRRPVRARSR